jgi:cell division control protein 12
VGKDIERTVSIDVVRAGKQKKVSGSLKYLDIIEKGFNVRLSVIDTPGFGDYMNNQDCWVPIIEFLDEQHAIFMKSENSQNRFTNDDLRVHACLYFIHPTGHT